MPVELPTKTLWKQPWFFLFVAFILGILGIGLRLDWQTQRLLVILGDDQSQSGLAIADARKEFCQNLIDGLKTDDKIMQIAYADKVETTQDVTVKSMVTMLGFCQKTPVPKAIGKNLGTSPTQALTAALGEIESARAEGNNNPGLVALYLQAAETIPGKAPLNLDEFQSQVERITNKNAVVTIFGPTGELQQQLKNRLKSNARAHVWPLSDAKASFDWAFDKARRLKPNETGIAK